MFAGALVGAAAPAAGAASRVLVMDRHGRVHAAVDRALPRAVPEPAPPPAAGPAARRRARQRTLRGELDRLLKARQIDQMTHDADRRAFDDAIRTSRKLSGTRRSELLAVLANLHDIAARGELTAARLPSLFATLERNRQWWTTGRLLTYGQRVEFSDSELVWEYYPGEGIQLQVLGTFGKANGLWQANDEQALRALLDEMIPLASQRGPALAWEYDFDFGGGAPPWTSAMSQATGIQALARASQLLHDASYLAVAKRALGLFQLSPPVGVRLRTALGSRYLLYSYAPSQIVVNAFAQTLVGLHDYAQIAHDATAGALFRAGDRQLRQDLPRADTGAWSLYQLGGAESDLGYHELLQGFLQNLCNRTSTPVYCDTAQRFEDDLHEPPQLTLLSTRLRAGTQALVRFRLSKVSRVGMTIRLGQKVVLSTSASVSHGVHSYAWKVPARPGGYDVTLTGTDLAGNAGRTTATIQVLSRTPHA
jgi:D-glucuronyl C5-epimerase C-terminus